MRTASGRSNPEAETTVHQNLRFFDKSFLKSDGIYQGESAKQNCEAIKKVLGVEHLLLLDQVHGNDIVDADFIDDFSLPLLGDGSVTSKKGIALSVKTADCVPVLLESRGVVGAAHCGWRSAKLNILEKLVVLMQSKGATHIRAVIGPAIQQRSYEVGQEFYSDFLESESECAPLFVKKGEKFLFDLPGFVEFKLRKLNIVDIVKSSEDTYSAPEKYFSYRRDLHSGILRERKNLLSTVMISR